MSIVVPPPLGLGRPSRKSIQYRLVVIQHPTRARCCGFGEKDKRPINPPPILQLHVTNPNGVLTPVSETDNVSHLIVQCDLFSADRKENRNVVYNPASINPAYPNSNAAVMSFQDPKPMRNFLGTLVSNAHQLTDLQDRSGIFFIFHDISVRTEGSFCLRFRFIDLTAGEPLTMSTQVLHETFSDPFSVYSAKNFPGMTGTTPLSLCFSKQGIKISVRKSSGSKRSSTEVSGAAAPAAEASSSLVAAATAAPDVIQHQQRSAVDSYHQKSVTALTTFVSSGTQRTSGKEGVLGGASSSRTELKEANAAITTTTQCLSQEVVAAATASTSTTPVEQQQQQPDGSMAAAAAATSSYSSVTPADDTTTTSTSTTTESRSTTTTQYTRIHISSVLASDDDDDNNTSSAWPQYPWQ